MGGWIGDEKQPFQIGNWKLEIGKRRSRPQTGSSQIYFQFSIFNRGCNMADMITLTIDGRREIVVPPG